MELQEFVTTALKQIVDGVRDAQSSISGDGEINPHLWSHGRKEAASHGILESTGGKWVHLVEFDVAVTAGEATGNRGGIGVVVGAVALGSQRTANAESSTVSRIKFSVPVAYPRSTTGAHASQEDQ